MENLFIQASRQKLGFESKQGTLSVEHLWDIPLSSQRPNVATLDEIALALDKQIKDAGTTSYVKKATRTNETLKLKFDISGFVRYIRSSSRGRSSGDVARQCSEEAAHP